jgi:hypothetical protein
MEPQQDSNVPATNPAFKVTPLSKYLAMALFILMPFVGGWIGYKYAPEKVVEVERVVVREVNNADIDVDTNHYFYEDDIKADLPSSYSSSTYRVVTVLQNPYYSEESKYDSLVIVAPRGVNDHTCGGKYVPSNCYIFLESSYAYTPTPKFVGIWNSGLIQPETVKFTSPTEVSIGVANGDGCFSYKAEWKYDLNTGSSTRTMYEELSDC